MPVLVVLRGRVPAVEDGQEGYYRRREPAGQQHEDGDALRDAAWVAHGLDDRVVPVDRDEHEMEDGARAEVDVERVPDVAHEVAEQPLARDLDARIEGHGEHGDEHVGQSQRHDEVIGDDAELAVPDHRDHNQQIAEHRRYYYGAQDAAKYDCPVELIID